MQQEVHIRKMSPCNIRFQLAARFMAAFGVGPLCWPVVLGARNLKNDLFEIVIVSSSSSGRVGRSEGAFCLEELKAIMLYCIALSVSIRRRKIELKSGNGKKGLRRSKLAIVAKI